MNVCSRFPLGNTWIPSPESLPRSTAHMMHNIHHLAPSLLPPLCIHWDLHTLTLTLYAFTHSRLDALGARLCAVLRLRCLAQGRCGVALSGMVLLGIQEPRHVFRPPAGKYTFNATESAGAGGVHRMHNHFRWFSLKPRGGEGLVGRFSVSAHEVCTLLYTIWKLILNSSEKQRLRSSSFLADITEIEYWKRGHMLKVGYCQCIFT